jgi:transposase
MEDVLRIYKKPLNSFEPVVCLDEKPLVLNGEVRPLIQAKSGSIRKRDSEYKRLGTANAFIAVLPKAGIRHVQVTARRTAKDFAEFLNKIANKYRNAKRIYLIMDNLNTHKEKSLIDRYGKERGQKIWRRFKVHYTPPHGSWLNMAELELSVMSRQAIGKFRFSDIDLIDKQLSSWNIARNKIKAKIDWTFTAKDARKIFKYEPVNVI